MTRHSGSGRDIARELSPQSRSHPNEKLRGAGTQWVVNA